MAIQDIVNDVKSRVDTARKPYSEAFKAYVDAQNKALDVVSTGAQNLARTETDAARDVFAAARASFDQARRDGVRQVASQPQVYLPEGRERVISAYKATVDQIRKTGNELGDVVTKGYKSVLGKLTGNAASAGNKRSSAGKRTGSTAGKSSANNSGTSKSTASKSSASKSTTGKSSTTRSTASKSTAAKSTANKASGSKSTARKTASSRSSAGKAGGNNASNSSSASSS